jgi:hypothetical protein
MLESERLALARLLAQRLAQRYLNGEPINLAAEKRRVLTLESSLDGYDRAPCATKAGTKRRGWHKIHEPTPGRASGTRKHSK